MASKELKKLSRKELLELLIEQRDMLSQTQVEIEDTKEKPKRRFAANVSLKMKKARKLLCWQLC